MKIEKIIIAGLLFQLAACMPVVIGAGATTGVVLSQERTVGGAIDDTTIWTKIKAEYLQKNFKELFSKVSVNLSEGRVLLHFPVRSRQTLGI